jgi:predicted ferric reductase
LDGDTDRGGKRGVKTPGVDHGKWVGLYGLLVAGPTALMWARADMPSRGVLVDGAVAAGAAAFFVFCGQFILTARFLPLGRSLGVDAELRFHGRMGTLGAGLVLAHAGLLIAAAPGNLGYLNPNLGAPGGLILYGALLALGLLALSTLGRRALKIPYDLWRLTHGLLAGVVVVTGAVHMLAVGFWTSNPLNRNLVMGTAALALYALAHIRLVKPLLALRRPWVVAEVRYEAPKVWTLAVQALHHDGLRFAPGQYAWLTLGRNPFRLEQHPFTIASSAERHDRLEFVIKELGDFTSKMASVAPDTTAYVEGPYGGMPWDTGPRGVVFLAGGVGITPALAMLRTLRDRRDRRPFVLFHAVSSEGKLVFREELERLKGELALTVVPVLETPPPGWTGETGYISREILDRHLPREGRNEWDYLICGPDPMIEQMHAHLTALGVPRRRQRSERFNWV